MSGQIPRDALIRDLAIVLAGSLHPSAEPGPVPRLAASRVRDVLGIPDGETAGGIEARLRGVLTGEAGALRELAQARLPRELIGPVIATMDFGRTYYTVPWAMWADEDGLLWLHPDYETSDRPRGTASMRLELRDDGYHVWPARGHAYQPRPAGYVGEPAQPFIPVAALEGTEGRR